MASSQKSKSEEFIIRTGVKDEDASKTFSDVVWEAVKDELKAGAMSTAKGLQTVAVFVLTELLFACAPEGAVVEANNDEDDEDDIRVKDNPSSENKGRRRAGYQEQRQDDFASSSFGYNNNHYPRLQDVMHISKQDFPESTLSEDLESLDKSGLLSGQNIFRPRTPAFPPRQNRAYQMGPDHPVPTELEAINLNSNFQDMHRQLQKTLFDSTTMNDEDTLDDSTAGGATEDTSIQNYASPPSFSQRSTGSSKHRDIVNEIHKLKKVLLFIEEQQAKAASKGKKISPENAAKIEELKSMLVALERSRQRREHTDRTLSSMQAKKEATTDNRTSFEVLRDLLAGGGPQSTMVETPPRDPSKAKVTFAKSNNPYSDNQSKSLSSSRHQEKMTKNKMARMKTKHKEMDMRRDRGQIKDWIEDEAFKMMYPSPEQPPPKHAHSHDGESCTGSDTAIPSASRRMPRTQDRRTNPSDNILESYSYDNNSLVDSIRSKETMRSKE